MIFFFLIFGSGINISIEVKSGSEKNKKVAVKTAYRCVLILKLIPNHIQPKSRQTVRLVPCIRGVSSIFD